VVGESYIKGPKLIILDDVLSYNDFIKIKEFVMGVEIDWHYMPYKVSPFTPVEDGANLFDFQLVHLFYGQYSPLSEHINIIDPLIKVLEPSAILKIKANLVPATEKNILFGYHTDYQNFNGKTAIFYINDNNGYTQFENGDRVDSVANRLIIFDPSMKHAGSSCTDQKGRFLINFNYYEWTKKDLSDLDQIY
jgi:hypothetical protein